MPLLKHQIILHPDIVGQFSLEKTVTPYERQVGFSWYLCPVKVAGVQEWLLVNIEFGCCQLVIAPVKTPIHIGDAALQVIAHHLPEDRDEDNVSVSLSGDDVSWHTADKMPEHVAQRYQHALTLLCSCQDVRDAEDELDRLNDTPLTIGNRTFAPTEGLEQETGDKKQGTDHVFPGLPPNPRKPFKPRDFGCGVFSLGGAGTMGAYTLPFGP